jgi:acyl-coenzyme A thioesterase PaaI-like protein
LIAAISFWKKGDGMDILTHTGIDQKLCGKAVTLEQDFSRVGLRPDAAMAVDDSGLVHGGFIFGLADYAAMIAVNHPNVVLGAADVKFLKPVKANESIVAEASVTSKEEKRQTVSVVVKGERGLVFKGQFICFTPDRHVLS